MRSVACNDSSPLGSFKERQVLPLTVYVALGNSLSMEGPMNRPQVVSQQEWQAARGALLVKEKRLTRELDALAAQRRRLPMVRLDAGKYQFTAPDGSPASLTDLFDGNRQLVIYHFMLEPGQDWICGGCATLTDNFDSQS